MSRFHPLRTLLLLLMVSGLVAAPCLGQDGATDQPEPVKDDDLSYRNEPLAGDSGAPGGSVTSADPGDSQPVERAFENAPPVIPHNVDGLFPITVDENQCLDCHGPEEAADAEAPSVPASHTYDIRRDRQLDRVNHANYACNLCHAPQADVGELVGNDFDPEFRNEDSRRKSNLLEILNEGAK